MRHRCIAADCPLPEEIYDAKLRRPPACRLGNCRLEPIDAAPAAPSTHSYEPMPGEATWVPQLRRHRSTPVLIVGDRRFALPYECVLGRRGDVAREAFGDDPTVSFEHAQLTVRDEVAFLKNVSNGGHTLVVNGGPLAFGETAKLKPGRSRVRFGSSFTCFIELIV